MKKIFISSVLILINFILLSCGKKNEAVTEKMKEVNEVKEQPKAFTDHLNAGNAITFNNLKYDLAWSSHPSDNYYKQEYLMEEETPQKFSKMILLEFITGKTPAKEVAAKKVNELKKLKESDPMANYDVFEKNGEIMLDFFTER